MKGSGLMSGLGEEGGMHRSNTDAWSILGYEESTAFFKAEAQTPQ